VGVRTPTGMNTISIANLSLSLSLLFICSEAQIHYSAIIRTRTLNKTHQAHDKPLRKKTQNLVYSTIKDNRLKTQELLHSIQQS